MTDDLPERLAIVAGNVLYAAGDRADRAFFILSGTVDLTTADTTGRPVRTVRGPGEIVGDLALVDDSLRNATAVAATACELLVFSLHNLADRLENADPLVRAVFASMAARYSEACERDGPMMATPAIQPTWIAQARTASTQLLFEHQIRAGLERQEFELFFQPIVHLGTGQLAGVEALTRWRHPQRGLLMPSDFIGFAETCGAISALTTQGLCNVGTLFPSLKAAVAQGRGADRLFVAVNVSARDLEDPAFAATSASILSEAGVDPADVKLEVTEGILMADTERCTRTLQNCRDQGFAIAIDDFGTGYSSLNYLNQLPFTDLKMDRSFCQSLLADAAGEKIIAAIIHLGHDLGLTVIAEGVETVEQRERLSVMGCTLGQGYLFGPPMPHDAMLARIAAWPTSFAETSIDVLDEQAVAPAA